MTSIDSAVSFFFAVALFTFIFRYALTYLFFHAQVPPSAQLPRGPRGFPILGNLLQVPPTHSWIKFKEWADQYGPLYSLSLAGNRHVVVSTEKIANDLLRERGNIYSSRPYFPMGAEILSHNLRPVLLPYNELWRKGRKLMHSFASQTAASAYEPIQLLESSRLLKDLLADPSNYEKWFERYSAAVILRLAYGKTIETGDEKVVREILEVVHTVERVASPGAYLVDIFPMLMWLPKWLAPFKREGERLHRRELNLFRQNLDDVRADIAKGSHTPSFCRSWLEKEQLTGLNNDEAAYVIGTMFEAGAGTTAAAMMSFVLAMVHHPEWQRRLHQEIDDVVGNSRLPNFDDIPRLPITRAIVKETLRWRPVTAGGLPHQLIKDDVYQGVFLQAGTCVHPNQWAIHRDPTLYPDPESFCPERWLEPSWPSYREPLTQFPNLQNFSAFGFGRRICPGQSIAERSLNIVVARIGWGCTVSKLRDMEVPLYDYTTGFNVQPKKFHFSLESRGTHISRLLSEGL
ncbi:cytochrome P450 [Trichoderma velutinum]